jgi:hypothetical protein
MCELRLADRTTDAKAMARRQSRSVGALVLLLLFVSLNALFMGAIAIGRDVDLANRSIAIFIFLGLATWMVILIVGLRRALIGRWLTRRRWRRLAAWLGETGFREATRSEIAHTLRLPAHLLAPAILSPKRGGGIDQVWIGQVGGREARCFNARVRGGAWADVPVIALRVDGTFPATVLWRTKLGFPPRPGMKRVRFELERFNRSMSVYATDPYFASAVIDARVIEWLVTTSTVPTIEISDRWVVVWSIRRWNRTLEPPTLLEALRAFDDRIPRVVGSLFPGSADELLWPAGVPDRSNAAP